MAKNEARKTADSPTRQDDYAGWYRRLVRAADLVQSSPVRGCVSIRPWGHAIWENLQRELDARIRATGHENACFPLFIPTSLLAKETRHGKGFARECAVVTHHRLVPGPGGGLIPDPAAALEEPLVVRPTSETIIGAAFANWVQSYRDLPVLVNQWANVVRWERRTRPLLRSVEFLWQEGHTAHESEAEAREETGRMLDVYTTFARDFLAMPVIPGKKPHWERFPGAVETYAIEAMMQDRKALQAGTSHFLGQGFSRASAIEFQGRSGKREIAWTTSWGVSTRLLGALVMIHGDDDGLMLPPHIAPAHVVLLPVLRGDDDTGRVLEYASALGRELGERRFGERRIQVAIERRHARDAGRAWPWIQKGVPVRIELGLREVLSGTVTVARRDRPPGEATRLLRSELVARLPAILEEIQSGLHRRALGFREQHTRLVDTRAELDAFFAAKSGGFALSHWCGHGACEKSLKRALAVTNRGIPLRGQTGALWEDRVREPGSCVVCGAESQERAIFARAY